MLVGVVNIIVGVPFADCRERYSSGRRRQAVVRTLFTRASRQSSSLVHRSTEERHVVEALQEKGHPYHLIQKHHVPGRKKKGTMLRNHLLR